MNNEDLINLLKEKGLTDEQINNLLGNKAYWDKRFEQLQAAQINMAVDYYATLDKEFKKAYTNIQADIEKWYMRFANNEGITLVEARRRLNAKELEEFRWTVEEYIEKGKTLKYSDEWASALENASVRVHISRLEALKIQLQQQVEVLFNNQSDGLETLLTSIYEYGFYHTCYEIEKGTGLGVNINRINPRKLKAIISNPWASDGRNFSQRIWGKYRPQLVQTLHTEMTQACIRGDNPEKIINTISKKFDVSKRQSGNLVMTEQAYFSSLATQDGYKEIGVEEYDILATLDLHTSEICRELDGKTFKMSEYEPWVTAPPFHNRCRSTTTPHFEDDIGERIARGADGKQYMVPANMTYKEWYDKYVKDDVTAELEEKKLNNEYADRKQYEEYKKVLGKDAPKSFEIFQDLKYTDSDSWKELQSIFKQEDQKYKAYHFNNNGTIVVTDDWKGQHVSIPRQYKPYAVVETSTDFTNGEVQIDRTIYDKDGMMYKQIHSGHHNKPKQHQYGKYGEHMHYYNWNTATGRPERSVLELTEQDRIEHSDILKGVD